LTANAIVVGKGATPALFLHCSLASHQAIAPLASALPNLTGTCMDLLGHGANPPPDGPNDLRANANAAAALWKQAGWVVGHSYGAAVALRFALDHPERVSRLVLIEPVLFAAAAGGAGLAQLEKDFAPIAQAFSADDMETAARNFMALWGNETPWSKVPAQLRAYATARMGFIAESAADLEEDATGILSGAGLENLNVPTLLIRGKTTHPVIAEIHDALEHRLPNAAQAMISGAGHMAPVSHSADVADAIKVWAAGD